MDELLLRDLGVTKEAKKAWPGGDPGHAFPEGRKFSRFYQIARLLGAKIVRAAE